MTNYPKPIEINSKEEYEALVKVLENKKPNKKILELLKKYRNNKIQINEK